MEKVSPADLTAESQNMYCCALEHDRVLCSNKRKRIVCV
jgi:hypothetical protein